MNPSARTPAPADLALAHSFSRRQVTMMHSYRDDETLANPRCAHCDRYYCQIEFIFSWISRYGNSKDQQAVVEQRVQEILSKSTDGHNLCEQRLLHWYNARRRVPTDLPITTPRSAVVSRNSVVSPSPSHLSQESTTDYDAYLLSQATTSTPSQTFPTQNRAGLYQLCSNGRYIIADDWCHTYKGHRLPQSMRCLTIYNQYEEQCVLMLPEFNIMTQVDAVQSMTWHNQLQVFLFITRHRVYQCEPESGAINQISEYEIPSTRHSLGHIACDQRSFVFLAYEYPSASLDVWFISAMATWSLLKRWTPRELFPPPRYTDEDDEDDDDDNQEESGVCGIASMRFANGVLHFLARHERHWSLHLFAVSITEKHQRLLPQRRIDIDPAHLRFGGENFQMEVLPGEQGWLFAIRRPHLIHLDHNGKDARQVFLPTAKRCVDSIHNVCIMDERGKRRENGKHLVVRDVNTIRFYKL